MIRSPLDPGAVLQRIDELLEARYRSRDLGNVDDPLAETVYILLSKQTRELVYRRVYSDLRARYSRWQDVLAAPNGDLEQVLAPAGLQHQRTSHLKEVLNAVSRANRDYGTGPWGSPPTDLNLDFLRQLGDVEAERFLSALPGIGPKSARCVLAYSLERPAFAVDTHVHRIFLRLGHVQSNGRKRDHDPFQAAVPAHMRKRLHINLVHHGREVCRTQREKCNECVLVSFCNRGRESVTAVDAPVAVDLFAGAGGLGHGFRRAGFRVGLAVEPDRHAAQTYRLNNPGVPVIEASIDQSTDAQSLRRYMPTTSKITALLAGPPCQGYSAAGSRRPYAKVNGLYRHVARIAEQLEVDVVCLENVPGVARVNGRGFLRAIRNELRRAGFATETYLVHACEFGVPQHRARYFFLGWRGSAADTLPRPTPTHRPRHLQEEDREGDQLPETPRLIDMLSELPQLQAGTRAEFWCGEDGQEDYNLSTMTHGPHVVAKIHRIKPGEGPISYRRLEEGEARTLIAGHRALPVHPRYDRSISVREAAVIQGFPRDYIFCGPRAEQPLQVANAVPPPMAEAVARGILDTIDASVPQTPTHRALKGRHGRLASEKPKR